MWIIWKAAKAVVNTVTRAVTWGGSSNKNSSSNSSNKNSSSNSSNKNSSSNSSRQTAAQNNKPSTPSRPSGGGSTGWTKSGGSTGWTKSSTAWAGSVAWFSPSPSIGSIWWTSSGGWSLNSSRQAAAQNNKPSTPSRPSGWGSSSKSSGWSISWTTPVASVAWGWTRLANGTVVGKTVPWGVASMAWWWTRLANWTVVGWIWWTSIWWLPWIWGTSSLTNFRNVVSPTTSTGTGTTKGSWASWLFWLGAINTLREYAKNANPTSKSGSSTSGSWASWLFWLGAINTLRNAVKNSTPKFDYTKENANGSPARMSGANGTIIYEDGSVYDPKTWVTTYPKTWEVINAQWDNWKLSEQEIIQNANNRQNNSALWNSSTWNPIQWSWGWTRSTQNTKTNQSAMSMILNSLNEDQWWASMISNALDTGWNRTIESQERWVVTNEDGTQTYIAPNGKQYLIGTDDNWNLAFISQWKDTAWEVQNIQDSDWNIINDVNALVDYIRSQNGTDGINRSNVDNKDAYKWAGAEIEWTYVAPSGKEYDILTGTWENAGKTWFININWEAQWFDSQNAALDYIDRNNPVWNKDLAKNTALPSLADRGSYDGEIPETGLDAIDEQNEWNQDERDERDQEIADLRDEIAALRDQLENSSDEIDREKAGIIWDWLWSVEDFTTQMNDAVADLQEKSQMLQDNERMRWARQRAAELAAKWYLTSEQVAQVANYSLTDYNKELEASALEAAKAIAELKINLGQKRQDYINAIMSQRTLNASDKQSQINYINDWYTKYIDSIDSKMATADQFYHGLISSNLQMNAQQELWYDSIIRQNDAQNIVNDRNQQKAFTDTEYRRQYILNNITDANLHAYANQAINYLINQGKFIYPWKSNADNKRILAEQISKVTDVARQLQLANQKDLAKVS